MGVNFTAYFPHDLSVEQIRELCHSLNTRIEEFPSIQQFVEHLLPYNPEDVVKEWKFYPNCIGGTTVIDGPCGMSLTFSEKVCYFHHYIRWRAFLLYDSTQESLRAVCRGIASVIGASSAVYVPDNGSVESDLLDFIWEDRNEDFAYITNWLLENSGPPKDTIRDIYKEYEEYWDSEGYFIDRFEKEN